MQFRKKYTHLKATKKSYKSLINTNNKTTKHVRAIEKGSMCPLAQFEFECGNRTLSQGKKLSVEMVGG